MSVNTIVHLSLLNFLIYQNNAFALFHRIPCARKLCHNKLLSTVSQKSSTISVKKEKAEARTAKLLFYQNPPQALNVARNNININNRDTLSHQSAQVEGNKSIAVEEDNKNELDVFALKLSKLQDLANEGNGIIEKLRVTASSMSMEEASSNNLCCIDDLECVASEENYHEALIIAREADLKYGLGTDESLKAWATVDEMYLKLESDNNNNNTKKKRDIITTNTGEKKIDDIFEACDKLEAAFRELQRKIDLKYGDKT